MAEDWESARESEWVEVQALAQQLVLALARLLPGPVEARPGRAAGTAASPRSDPAVVRELAREALAQAVEAVLARASGELARLPAAVREALAAVEVEAGEEGSA